MASRTNYAGLTDGLQPLSLFDQSLADMGNLGVIPCTASGTNAVVLTPLPTAFAPNVTIPNQLQNFSFVAAGNSTGPITIKIGTASALNLYKEDGVTQASTNDLLNKVLYGIVFNSALNSNAGGYQITFPITSVINPVITGATISNSTITTSTYNGNTWTAGTGTLTIAALKTLTVSNALTLAGTDSTTMTFPTTSATIARTDTGQTFTGTQAFGSLTATTINGNTLTAGSWTLTGTAAKTLSFSNSLTLAGTDGTTMTFPTTSATIARTDAGNTFIGTQNLASLTASSSVATDASKNLVSVTNTGSGNNVLATSPVLTTPTLGAATATTVAFSPTTGGIIGTATNDSASAGNVGEYIESVIPVGSLVSLVTNTPKNITSISLTAGDWDVSANLSYFSGASASVAFMNASISTTTATIDQTNGRSVMANPQSAPTVAPSWAFAIQPLRFSLTTPTTIFLVSNQTFTVGTLSAFGLLRARRVR